MSTQSSVVYRNIQKVLGCYSWGVPLFCLSSCLKIDYQRISLDTNDNSSHMNHHEELMVHMRNLGMVLFLPERNWTYVMSACTVKTRQKVLKRDVQELLDEYYGGIPVMSFESAYKDKRKVKLDYHFFGLKDIEELFDVMHTKGVVLFYEKPESKKKYVISVRQVDYRRESLKLNVQKLLSEYGGTIPVRNFEGMYMDKFMVKLDYHLCCLKDFDHLCEVLNLVVEGANLREEVKKEGKIYCLRKRKVTDGTNILMQSSVVYLEIQEVLGLYFYGLPMLHLSCLKTDYRLKFKRPLNYDFLGVKDIKELVDAMHTAGMVLFYENPESKEKYVMCARTVKTRQEVLMLDVQELLDEYDGGIPLMSFESVYKDKFKVKLDYHFLGLKDIEELFDVMHTKGMVLFYENPYSKEEYVMCARTVKTRQEVFKRDVQKLLDEYDGEILLTSFESLYKDKFKKNLNYAYLGVKDIEELFDVMDTKGMVLLYEKPESKEKYVVSVHHVNCRREILKRNVQEIER